jgi:hypothetical protein
MEQALLELAKKKFNEAQKESDFEMYDFGHFASYVKEIEKIESMKLKPYLIKWNMNMWHPYFDFVDSALEILGYEYIGKMDMNDESDQYKFEYKDINYDTLYRYKDKNADYTKIYKVEE